MNYYKEIKNKLIDNEIYSKTKDYTKERHKVMTYYEIGRLLSEAGKAYGESIIEKYADKLVVEVGKKYNKRTLFRIRQFYEVFKNKKMSTLSTLLSWSHYSEMLVINLFLVSSGNLSYSLFFIASCNCLFERFLVVICLM